MSAGINRVRFQQYPLQEKKLNLFVDYYHYFTHFAGRLSTFDLDNPHSLVDKIIFQLENNKEDKSVTYLRNHFRRLNSYPKAYIGKFSFYKDVISIYTSWPDAKGKYPFKYIKDNQAVILQTLKNLRQELANKIIEDAVDCIKHFVLCNCSLKKHLRDIIFYTRLLASEIIMVRKSRNEALELFREVMTNEFTKFPYPNHIVTDDDKRKYFDTKTIHETFEAIKHFSNKMPSNWDINFKIEGMTMPSNYVFHFGNTSVYPAHHPAKQVMEERVKNSKDTMINDFFDGDEYSIAEVNIKCVTYHTAYREAVTHLNYTLEYISQVLGQNVPVNRLNYFFSTDKENYGYNFRGLVDKLQVNQFNRFKLEDNAYEVFRKNSSAAKDEFLQFEKVYVEARGKNDVSGLWQYLEGLFKYATGERKLKKLLSGAILLHEKQFRYPQIYDYLRNAIHVINTNCKDIGLTIEEQTSFIRKEKDLKAIKDKITSDFFHQGYRDLKTYGTKNWLVKQREYYNSLLEDAYEQRNFLQHGGILNERANIKLIYSFPLITVRMRWVIFDYIKKYPKKNLKEIFHSIKMDVDNKYNIIDKIAVGSLAISSSIHIFLHIKTIL